MPKSLRILARTLVYVFVAALVFSFVGFLANNHRRNVKARVADYSDLGKGIVVINLNRAQLGVAFSQWKQDYPQKAKAVMAAAFDRNEFVVIYKTE